MQLKAIAFGALERRRPNWGHNRKWTGNYLSQQVQCLYSCHFVSISYFLQKYRNLIPLCCNRRQLDVAKAVDIYGVWCALSINLYYYRNLDRQRSSHIGWSVVVVYKSWGFRDLYGFGWARLGVHVHAARTTMTLTAASYVQAHTNTSAQQAC